MTQSPSLKTKATKLPRSAVTLLLLTILDTTWRAFIPPVGGTMIGIALDNLLHRAPLFTSLMIIVGFTTSALLIGLQIRRVRRS